MIVLGIDPGTAALGYGLVEQEPGRLRAVDFGCLNTSVTSPTYTQLTSQANQPRNIQLGLKLNY